MAYIVGRQILLNGVLKQPGDPIDPSECHNLRVLLATKRVIKVPNKQAPPPSPPSDIGLGVAAGARIPTSVLMASAAQPKPSTVAEGEGKVEEQSGVVAPTQFVTPPAIHAPLRQISPKPTAKPFPGKQTTQPKKG